MKFIYIDSVTHQVIDILSDRSLATLQSHFNRYSAETRSKIETIVIDMNTPYLTPIPSLFPQAKNHY